MKMSFTIPVGEHNYNYTLLPAGWPSQTIIHEGVIYLRIIKRHNHNYELSAFVYKGHKYVYPKNFSTKSKLYGAIQKLLQEEL